MLNENKINIIVTLVISAVLLILFYAADITFFIVAIILLVVITLMKDMKKQGTQLVIIVMIAAKILSIFLDDISVIVVFSIVFIIQALNLITILIFTKQAREKFIEEKILIAKRNMIEDSESLILITKEDSVIWANDKAYDEFSFLLKEQSLKIIKENTDQNIFTYDNKFYSVSVKDDIYYLFNITDNEREHKKLVNLQLIIGLVQIDNHTYLQQTMDRSEFLEMDTKIKLSLIDWFKSENIYYQQIDDDKFQINIPYTVLQKSIEDKFPKVSEIIDKIKEEGFEFSLSLGIAYNYSNNLEIGQMANEALELANSRGGAQTVIFNNGKRSYFGGKISNSKSNIRIRARFIYNTIVHNADTADVIYLMAHQNADYDALSSMLLVANFMKHLDKEIKIMLDKNSKPIIMQKAKELISEDMLYFDTVVDMTKSNLLIIVDTQSKDYVSHPQIVEEINDCIVIDHHQTPENYIEMSLFTWVEPTASSTTELIVNMYLSIDAKMDNKELAMLALLAIITDTNNLKFRISSSTINAIGYLIEQKATLLDAMEALEISKDDYLHKKAILNQAVINDKVALIEINYEIEDDLHAIVANELIEIKEIYLVAVICQIGTDKYKLKMRSDGRVNSKTFIGEFGGGGHARQAAGIFSANKIELIKEKMNKLHFEE